MLFRIFSFFIIVGCSACRPSVLESALERAGENRIELERVLRHYSEEDKDSLKWEAARFLIENMPGHLSIGGDSIGPYYAALNAVFSNDTLRNWQDSLDKIHEYYKSGLRVQEDIKVIKSGFLIANIDSAFRSGGKNPGLHMSVLMISVNTYCLIRSDNTNLWKIGGKNLLPVMKNR